MCPGSIFTRLRSGLCQTVKQCCVPQRRISPCHGKVRVRLEFGRNRFQFVLAPGQNAFHQRLNGAGQRPITADTALHLGIYFGMGSGIAMVIGLVVQPG